MVSMLATSVVDRGFKSRSDQTKDFNINICCFSAQHVALRSKSKDWSVGSNRIICPVSEATCLPTNCCYSELALKKNPAKGVGLVQSGPHHHLIKN